jgi:hypothetical protein
LAVFGGLAVTIHESQPPKIPLKGFGGGGCGVAAIYRQKSFWR